MCVCIHNFFFCHRGMFNRDCHCARLINISYRTSLAFGDRACYSWYGRRTFFSLCYDLLSPFFFSCYTTTIVVLFLCLWLLSISPVYELRRGYLRSLIIVCDWTVSTDRAWSNMVCTGPVSIYASLNRRTQPSLWFFASHPAVRGIVLVAIFIFIKVSLHVLNQKG